MPIGFHLNQDRLEVSGLNTEALRQGFVDESPLNEAAIEASDTGFTVALPASFFDGRPHRVKIVYTQNNNRHISVFDHQSIYSGHITKRGEYLHGYMYDETRPEAPLILEVELDGHALLTLHANEMYPSTTDAARTSGFTLPTPVAKDDPAPHILSVRLSGTDFYPLGRILININSTTLSLPDNIVTASDLRRTISNFRTWYLLNQSRLVEQGSPATALPEIWQAGGHFYTTRQTMGIDVIVPVYKGYDETFACLKSVLKARNDQPLNLIVINDKSPDVKLTRELRLHAARHNYRYIENDKNLGFVHTVNKGMRLNPDNDVVLLNSDTEVSDEWLDRLYHAAYSDETIGSVSPLSNQATILNLPTQEGCAGIPYGMTLKGINDLCAEQNTHKTLDLPTTHGFCMFIRRDCLNQSGLFDEIHFGKGYGEENEFCMRSYALGWRHVAALDTFVYHKNGVSFGQNKPKALHSNLKVLRSLYPNYEGLISHFNRHDPMTSVRNRLQISQWLEKPCVVFFTSSLGGGVSTHIDQLCHKMTQEGYRILLAHRGENKYQSFILREWGSDNSLTYLSTDSDNTFYADILRLKPRFLHLHHLLDMPNGIDDFLLRSGIPYYITLHDYFYISPSVTLLNEGEIYNDCATPDDLRDPQEHRRVHTALHPDYISLADNIRLWHDKWGRLLENAHTVIAPDISVVNIYKSVFPDILYLVRPHVGPLTPVIGFRERTKPETVRVAILGTLTAAKGGQRILNFARWAETNAPTLRFVVHGYSERADALKRLSNVEYYGPYPHEELPSRLANAPCHTALFLSGWPETYSYTLTEALKVGLTPVCLDVGAFSTRLSALEVGERLPLNATSRMLADAIYKASTRAIIPDSYTEGNYDNLITDYYDFTPAINDETNATWLPISTGLYSDGWCEQQVGLEFLALRPVNCLKLSLYLPEARRHQSVTIHINDEIHGRFDLAPNILSTPELITSQPLNGHIRVVLKYAHAHPLSSTDPRIAAARLTKAQFIYDSNAISGTEGLETPEAVRELQALYTDVTRYALSRERETVKAALKGSLSDLSWTVRLLPAKGVKGAFRAFQAMRYLRRSSFDSVFYGLQKQSSQRPQIDSITHYVAFGADEGLDPAPGFSTRYYLQAHDDIARTGINPFYHYMKNGMGENRRTEPSDQISLFLKTRNGSERMLGALRLAGLGNMRHLAETPPSWPKRDTPEVPIVAAGDIRPDDVVLDEAYSGEAFFKRFDLLGRTPQWKKAIDYLNTLKRNKPTDTIDVSIVIPVYGQLSYTLNLLDSLLRHDSKYNFEIIIGDDASPDQSPVWLSRINDVNHIHYEQNEGFIANCNKTAAIARGDFIVLLNNDTRVCQGWLDSLIDIFEQFPDTGLAGSKLLYPDGSLQEAGGIVWKDGSAWNYGRDDDPNRPEYCYARHVDYISGASIALKRMVWEQMKGFDTYYTPAYYEDTDLAFRLRAQGYKVTFQPASRVIHYEGKTSGTDTSSGIKSYQTTNCAKFYARWEDTLSTHRANGEHPELERDRTHHKHVLILDAVNPRINQDAGSNATRDLFLYYQALGYSVSFVPEDNFLYEPDYVPTLQAMGIEASYAPYVSSLSTLLNARPDYYDVIHLIRPTVAHRNLETIKRLAPKAKIVYLNADLHYLRMERQSLIENRPSLKADAAAMKTKELAITRAVDITLVHSSTERDILLQELPDARIHVLPLIDDIITNNTAHAKRTDVMFLGGYNHPPNIDAARWLLNDIWPLLSQRLPEARLLLIGSNPPQELKEKATDRIIVTGRVDNLSEWFDQTRVFLAPLRYGAGAKGKLIAAMGHGVPIVATNIAVEGLDLAPDEGAFTADTPESFIQKTVGLYRLSAKEWRTLSILLQKRVETNHSFEAGLSVLRKALS